MTTTISHLRHKAINIFKKLLVLLLLTNATNIKAQESFKIGDFFEIYNHDSLKVYFNSMGRIVGKHNAKFIRVGKRDPMFMNVSNQFKDYDMKGNLVFKGVMLNNYLNGSASYFHSNGVIEEEGNFKDDIRTGIWKYYYPNGKLSKIIEFHNGNMVIKEAYSKAGKPQVINGNGNVKILVSKFRQVDCYEASGMLNNSKMNKKWKLYTPELDRILLTETFEDNNFIKGEEASLALGHQTYTDYQRIRLTRFYPNEALDFSAGETGYPTGQQIQLWKYKEGKNVDNIYRLFWDNIYGKYKSPLADQWVIIGFKINENNSLSNINISSSIYDETFNKFLYEILAQSTGWKSGAIATKKVSSDHFYSLIVKNNRIIVPKFYENIQMQKLNKTWDNIVSKLSAYNSK